MNVGSYIADSPYDVHTWSKRTYSFCHLGLWPMILTFKLDAYKVKLNRCAKYAHAAERWFRSTIVAETHTQSGSIAFLATKVIAKIVTDRRENSENNTRQKRAFIVIRLPAHYLLCSTSATLWVRFCGKYTLNQGSQTHLSMWATVEDNSQSAGRTTKCSCFTQHCSHCSWKLKSNTCTDSLLTRERESTVVSK